jgi:hypothetical protein
MARVEANTKENLTRTRRKVKKFRYYRVEARDDLMLAVCDNTCEVMPSSGVFLMGGVAQEALAWCRGSMPQSYKWS